MYHRHARNISPAPAPQTAEFSTTEGTTPMPEPQNYKNHVRWDPLWHFFIAPVLLLNILAAIAATIHHWPHHGVLFLWWILISIALFLAVGKARSHSLKAQDRIIRLEERLRLAALLSAEENTRSRSLTESQLIALRFASDDELPALVKRTLNENLTPKQIKESINSWKPDYFRV
jgi:hypothetical protein